MIYSKILFNPHLGLCKYSAEHLQMFLLVPSLLSGTSCSHETGDKYPPKEGNRPIKSIPKTSSISRVSSDVNGMSLLIINAPDFWHVSHSLQ